MYCQTSLFVHLRYAPVGRAHRLDQINRTLRLGAERRGNYTLGGIHPFYLWSELLGEDEAHGMQRCLPLFVSTIFVDIVISPHWAHASEGAKGA